MVKRQKFKVNKRTEKRAIAYAESGSQKDFGKLPYKARRLVREWEANVIQSTR